jgi:hypothetical protein
VRHDGKLGPSRRWLARVAGAAVLAAGLLTAGLAAAGLAAGPAWASPVLAHPAAAGSTGYFFAASVTVKALGRTWSFDLTVTDEDGLRGIVAGLDTDNKGVIESHEWGSATGFGSTLAKEFTATNSGHAVLKTGSALSPVLTASLTFTPTRHTKEACVKGTGATYFGRLTGSYTLTTGLRGVKLTATFNGNAPGASMTVSDNCVAPTVPSAKVPCTGGFWSVAAVPLTSGSVGGIESLTPKPAWQDSFIRENVPTASMGLTRTDDLSVPGTPAPTLNTKTHTVAVTGTASGPITGAAVITYGPTYTPPPVSSCYVGSKHYSEKTVYYTGTSVRVSKPFKADTVLTGTQAMTTGPYAEYVGISLTAKK